MNIVMFILLVAVIYLGMKHEVLPRWGNRRQSCCDSSVSHDSSEETPRSQPTQRRRRIRNRIPGGARSGRRSRRDRQSVSSGSATAGAATAEGGGNGNRTSSTRMRWRPSWQQIGAGAVIVALLLGNIYQAVVISGLSDRIAALEERVTASSEEDGPSYADGHPAVGDDAVQTASVSNDPEAVEECASQVHFFARDTQNGFWGSEVDVRTHQAAIAELEERVCKDPALLTALRTRLGLNDLEFVVEEQVARATAYHDDHGREAWRSAVDELMAHIDNQNVRLGLETGRYETFFMDESRGGVPWIFQDTQTAGDRKVLRVGDVDLQLLCGFQPRSAAPAPTPEPAPAPTRQPAPTQPAPEHEHRDEPPARQVRQEPPSEEEPERDQPPADDSEEEEPSGDAPKIRVCDTRNGELVIVQIEHAREFSHFKQEDHSACAEDDEPADDGDEVADKPCDEDGTCGTPNEGAEQQPVGDNADEHEDSTEGYEDPNREDTAEPGPAEENAAEQDEAAEAVDSGDADDLDQTESGLESDDAAPGDSEESATAPSEQADDEQQQEGAGGDNPQGDGTEPPSGTDNDTSNDAGSEGSQTDNSKETEDTGDPGAEMELPETSTASAG